MNDNIDIEIILRKQKYHPIYNIGTILIIILLVFLYVSCTYKYQTYYITKGTIKNDKLELLVDINSIKYIYDNNILTIDNINYQYYLESISEELYLDESLNNFKYLYLNVNHLSNIENYVYELKIKKENKRIIEYLIDYL